MKKILSIILVLIAIFSLFSCAKNEPVITNETKTQTTVETTETKEDVPHKILFIGNSDINVPLIYQQFVSICQYKNNPVEVYRMTFDGTSIDKWQVIADALYASDPTIFSSYDTLVLQRYQDNEDYNKFLEYFRDDIKIYGYLTSTSINWEKVALAKEKSTIVPSQVCSYLMGAVRENVLDILVDNTDHNTSIFGFYTAMTLYYQMFNDSCFDIPYVGDIPKYATEDDVQLARQIAQYVSQMTQEQITNKDYLTDTFNKLKNGDIKLTTVKEGSYKINTKELTFGDNPYVYTPYETGDETINIFYLTDSYHDSTDSTIIKQLKELIELNNIKATVKVIESGAATLDFPGYVSDKTQYESLSTQKKSLSKCDILIMEEPRTLPMAAAAQKVLSLFPESTKAYYLASQRDLDSDHFGEFKNMLDNNITTIPYGHAAMLLYEKNGIAKYPGLTEVDDYYTIITNDLGSYMAALTIFRTIFGIDASNTYEFGYTIPSYMPSNIVDLAKEAINNAFKLSKEELTSSISFNKLYN